MTGTFFTSMNSLVRGGTDKLRYKNKIRETRNKTLSIYEETIIAVPTMSLRIIFSEQARSIVSNLILSTENSFSYFLIFLF